MAKIIQKSTAIKNFKMAFWRNKHPIVLYETFSFVSQYYPCSSKLDLFLLVFRVQYFTHIENIVHLDLRLLHRSKFLHYALFF